MRQTRLSPIGVICMLAMGFAGFACDRPDPPPTVGELPEPKLTGDEVAGPDERREAVFAGGCFWCVEAVFEQLEGVEHVTSGYAGGSADSANYQAVASGATTHAEVVHIVYDPAKINYSRLLRVFFATHDPTQLNGQGPDHGPQYRSAVFYADDAQKQAAEGYINQLEDAGVYDRPVVTSLEALEAFYPAEEYHQDFVQNNPSHPYVRRWATPKLDKMHEQFSDHVKSGASGRD